MSIITGSLGDSWQALPESLRRLLRLGFAGRIHLCEIAAYCLDSEDVSLAPIGLDAALTAFGENPLGGGLARELLATPALVPLLPRESGAVLSSLVRHWAAPSNIEYFQRLLARRDFPKIKRFIETNAARDAENAYWREQALTFGLIDADPDWVEAQLDLPGTAVPEPCLNAARAQVARFRGHHVDAARMYQETGPLFGPAFAAIQAGHCLLASGDADTASLLFLDALRRTPWNTSLILRVHDLVSGADRETHALPGSCAVLLYTWNKAEELAATLDSLLGSELEDCALVVLDNGSTDRTPEVLAEWLPRFADRLGADNVHCETLPVNIGAPAARNWLMNMDMVRQRDFVCYLDDDVELPADWLPRLGAAVHCHPDAGVYGCRVVDHANPALIQHADQHLLVPEDASFDLSRTEPNPFRLSNLHVQTLDFGAFDVLRSCASVTGCCHLFRTEILLESGPFALHLSPSQYDDMEHDLRLAESGRFAVYQGHLAVRHRKRSGVASRISPSEEGNALGNKYKMQTMHSRVDLLAAAAREQELLECDLSRRIRLLDDLISA
ncbi:glycosyltransferase family 2 protein [Pseudodesulfovibrio tunisiensis]|uniref:glycosyltransferase family 2 protein n=1 Tax=Pseudodesulfovibrio tunisiensis TaxID=463192 RepID=UPI001FB464C2|nr:glycosyltransferase [Pseudodesulfovibrio tunisiensis]